MDKSILQVRQIVHQIKRNPMDKSILQVRQIVHQIKGLLEGEFHRISVEGELSNVSRSGAGHWYFTLSDREASLQGALFRGDAAKNPLIKELSDGDKVICHGHISVYSKRGTFQLITQNLARAGKGDFVARLEALKKKLTKEGLFDLEKKKPIPSLPRRVGIITSPSGAALQDFLNIYRRRGYWMDIVLAPAPVQGDQAPEGLRQALYNLIKYSRDAPEAKKIDVIVLTRGGGSLEDLWPFNDEPLAWDIFNCPIPVISAVGHQINFSISDHVADLRCETPSAAAEILTRDQQQLQMRLQSLTQRLAHCAQSSLKDHFQHLDQMNPHICLDILRGQLGRHQRQLAKLNLGPRLLELTGIHEKTFQLDELLGGLQRAPNNFYQKKFHSLERACELLLALGPQEVLSRGYSYITTEKNQVISKHKEFTKLKTHTTIKVNFYDGVGNAKITEQEGHP